jgi:calcineurin-like phosphoesterase
MNILFIGDIFGKKGREAIRNELLLLKKKYDIDFTIANAENTTHGRSLNNKHYKELQSYGIDFFTMGNHT